MISKLWFTLLLVLTPLSAKAGIRVIYGGGGYGEMQALSALDQLNAFVEPLVYVSDWTRTPYPLLNHLNEAQLLRRTWTDGIFKTGNLVVEFAAPDVPANANSNLRINPASLYDQAGVPKSREAIFEEVFVARLTAQDALPYANYFKVTPENLRSLARELNSKFDVFNAKIGNDEFMLDFTGVRFKESGLALQTSTRWIQDDFITLMDLTLSNTLPCEIPGPVTVSKVSDLNVEDGRIHGRIEWTCGARQRARGRISFTPRAKGELPAIKVTQVEYPFAVCNTELTQE